MQFGVCYYPEQWPAERWPVDAALMREAGFSIVRLGEFAWAQMEPAEGQFDWEWLDRAMEILVAENLRIVLCTPTAAPPAWLCRAYPEVLPVDAQGRTRRFGSRRHYCVNSASYRRHTVRIVSALAERYGRHPAVIGWQIDNEFGCHDTARCYCSACAEAFRRWLQVRYGTLEALNQAWGTTFWSQVYSDWEQVDPPMLTVAGPNPSHALDYYRFASDSNLAYQQLQIDLLAPLRSPLPSFISSNLMGLFTDLDYHALSQPLDLVSWDSYPTGYQEQSASALYWPGEARPALVHDLGDPAVTGFCHDLVRGLKQAPFWVMEQQCGHVNWGVYNPGVDRGAVRLWAWHALARGADALVFFRWRASLAGMEQFHSGLLRHDGSPGAGYAEIEAMKAEQALMERVARHRVRSPAALLLDYADLWALQLQPHRRDFSYLRHLFVFYRALQQLGLGVDIVSPGAALDTYQLVIAPTAFLGRAQVAADLVDFVSRGGTLLLGVRSGFKTNSNRVTDQPLPGLFRDLVGATVVEWRSLPPAVSYELVSDIPGLEGAAQVWAESLAGPAPVRARYGAGPWASQAALVENRLGKGRALYLGWYPTVAQAVALLDYVAAQLGLPRSPEPIPEGVVVAQRGPFTVVLNFTDTEYQCRPGGRAVTVGPRALQVLEHG